MIDMTGHSIFTSFVPQIAYLLIRGRGGKERGGRMAGDLW